MMEEHSLETFHMQLCHKISAPKESGYFLLKYANNGVCVSAQRLVRLNHR